MVRAGVRSLRGPLAVAGSESAKPADAGTREHDVDFAIIIDEVGEEVKPDAAVADAPVDGYNVLRLPRESRTLVAIAVAFVVVFAPVALLGSPRLSSPAMRSGEVVLMPDKRKKAGGGRRARRIALIRARPREDRQLSDDGPLIFWRSDSGGRQGMVCSVNFCSNPACPCRDAQVMLLGADDGLKRVELLDDGLVRLHSAHTPEQAAAARPERVAHVMVDMDSGTVRPNENSSQDEELIAWFRAEAQDPMLLELLRRRRQAIATEPVPPGPDLDPRDWKPGDVLAYGEVFADAPDDTFGFGGRRYDVVDLHCIDPGCDCDDAVLLFMEIPTDAAPDEGIDIGVVHVDAATGVVREFEPAEHVDPKGVREAWSGFCAGRVVSVWLGGRRQRLRDVGPEILRRWRERNTAKAAPTVCRNDPCPCGSGKKYKRCCGA